MVVLDAIHWIQQHAQPDLAARWNCKAAKCGSCSAEINGQPSLMCKTRLHDFPEGEAITVEPHAHLPARPRPRHRRLLELQRQRPHHALHAAGRRAAGRSGAGSRRTSSARRSSASASSASCAWTSATCCATTRPRTSSSARASSCAPPASRCIPSTRPTALPYLKHEAGIGYCNINKCCTDVCPEHIRITDNAIIPLKERVADEYYDPLRMLWRRLRGQGDAPGGGTAAPSGPGRSAGHRTCARATTRSRRRGRRRRRRRP